MIKLIASDMDGTLLESKMEVSDSNVAAIREAERLNIEFMVATGRNYQEAKTALDEAGIQCAMITLNGAQVFDETGESLFTVGIPKDKVHQMMDLFEKNDIYFEIATNQGIFSDSQPKRIENFATHISETMPHLTHKMAIAMASAHLEVFHIQYVDDLRAVVERPGLEVLKMICFSMEGPKVLGPLALQVEQLQDLAVTSSAQNNIEINHKDAQKGIAVIKVAHERGIPLEQVMTIGDNFNDVSMLDVAGVSFAMGNAEPEVKEHAKYVTSTNLENGVGEAIMRAINEDL